MTRHFNPSRRDLLKGGGALVVSFSLSGHGETALAQEAAQRPLSIAEVDAFLAIDARGRVTVYSGKVDLGTGVRTALAQMAAEELDVPFNTVRIVEGDTALTPDQGKTWGSLTIQAGGVQIRNAAATARAALIEQAAQRLKAKPEELSVTNGVISAGNRRVTYGELIGGKMFSIKLDHAKPAKSKDPKDYKIVGKSVPRVDIPAKVTGRFPYINNLRVRGMLHGRVIRPPSVGAKLESVDEGSIKDIAGIVRVVREGNFLGVVAQTEWGAIKAVAPAQGDVVEMGRAAGAGQAVRARARDQGVPRRDHRQCRQHRRGDGQGGREEGRRHLRLRDPHPRIAESRPARWRNSATASSRHGRPRRRPTICASSSPRCSRCRSRTCAASISKAPAATAATATRMRPPTPPCSPRRSAVRCGCSGRAPTSTAGIRKARPHSLIFARRSTAPSVTAWESEFFIPQQTDKSFMVPLIPATLAGMPAKADIAPGNIFQNSNIPYKFANIKAVCHRLETTPFRPSWIRTPGRMQNTYANECFLDELAAAANADPIEFRLKYLDPADKRGIETLNRVAALAKWDKRPSPQQNVSGNVVKGRGVSYVKYELSRTYVAVVAEVEVDRAAGRIKVTKVYMAHDCGQIINPDGLRNQLDGNVIQMVSRTLIEELKFDRSHVTSLDWESYPVITFPDVPEIVLDLIDRPNERPWGAGEPAAAVVPSAISNAVFDATGVRLRSVPYTPDKVKAAMRSGA